MHWKSFLPYGISGILLPVSIGKVSAKSQMYRVEYQHVGKSLRSHLDSDLVTR